MNEEEEIKKERPTQISNRKNFNLRIIIIIIINTTRTHFLHSTSCFPPSFVAHSLQHTFMHFNPIHPSFSLFPLMILCDTKTYKIKLKSIFHTTTVSTNTVTFFIFRNFVCKCLAKATFSNPHNVYATLNNRFELILLRL